ncbi:flagellar hook-associated protein FlgL [Comamonas testosteroni]|uniref:Flagellar hook-associated protein 3 n=1 Tax=Comamonas testosteroni (strain DSM 14576 / KF-1) TaxID=399795 RepID=B7WY08_COMTK|nr:flagellar hook-associated protein FlgL [Comamonas testosteroni]EED69706.1 flagellar hook-associated protein 3 [Comamonas testosteroni KF-1]WQG67661.1 flagellar hook-associated protein FlgL [Comamonas testosteroni]
MSINRIGTANMYDSTINNLGSRQSSLVDLMEKTTAGKRVLRASDDPVAAAQAERARTRITRSENDQRVLGAQRDVIAQGESELGKAHSALQDFRDLVVQAGNGSYDQVARDALVQQMESLREQILGYANAKDSNGLPIFRGLGSPDTPLQSTPPGSSSQLNPGQNTGSDNGLPISLDGHAAWLNVPTGNGVFVVNGAASNSGKAWADVGSVTDPSQVTGDSYTLVFTKDPTTGEISYEINSSSATATNPVVAATPYKEGQAITVGGQQISIKGTPADGDSFTMSPSTRTDIFSVLDQAIATVKGGTGGSTALQQGLGRALSELDSGMNRVQAMRSYAGDQLKRADSLESDMKDQALTQEGARSRAEDIDMITALSQVETQKVGLQAALQSYAQMQKLSLFNYIG